MHLSEVELRILLGRDTLNLNQRCVGSCVALAALVAQNASFAVQSTREKKGWQSVLKFDAVASQHMESGAATSRTNPTNPSELSNISHQIVPASQQMASDAFKSISHLVEPIIKVLRKSRFGVEWIRTDKVPEVWMTRIRAALENKATGGTYSGM
jgi:hypothetical protein